MHLPNNIQSSGSVVWAQLLLGTQKIAIAGVYCTQENSRECVQQNELLYTELVEHMAFRNLHNYKVILCMDANAHVASQL